jgi:hypothetical protein
VGKRVGDTLDASFLEEIDASKRRWHEPSAQQKGITFVYRWTGPGSDGLEVAYGTAESRPNAALVREVWKQRHGHRAAPLLLVVAYPAGEGFGAVLCGPAGDDSRVVDLDYEQAEKMAATALGESDRHMAIRFLSEALECEPDEHPSLRNKGLFATHELLYGAGGRSIVKCETERCPNWFKQGSQTHSMYCPNPDDPRLPSKCASKQSSLNFSQA